MKVLLITILCLVVGCVGFLEQKIESHTPVLPDLSKDKFWKPTEFEKSKGEEIGKLYAYKQLGLNGFQLSKMETDFIGWYRNGMKILFIQFYDPEYHQPIPDIGLEPISGGFPTYFTISVDVESWKVVDHYASRE